MSINIWTRYIRVIFLFLMLLNLLFLMLFHSKEAAANDDTILHTQELAVTVTPTGKSLLEQSNGTQHWGVGVVNVGKANLRAGPGKTYSITGWAELGDILEVYGRNEEGTWLQVDMLGNKWIAASLIDFTETSTAIPTPNSNILESSSSPNKNSGDQYTDLEKLENSVQNTIKGSNLPLTSSSAILLYIGIVWLLGFLFGISLKTTVSSFKFYILFTVVLILFVYVIGQILFLNNFSLNAIGDSKVQNILLRFIILYSSGTFLGYLITASPNKHTFPGRGTLLRADNNISGSSYSSYRVGMSGNSTVGTSKSSTNSHSSGSYSYGNDTEYEPDYEALKMEKLMKREDENRKKEERKREEEDYRERKEEERRRKEEQWQAEAEWRKEEQIKREFEEEQKQAFYEEYYSRFNQDNGDAYQS